MTNFFENKYSPIFIWMIAFTVLTYAVSDHIFFWDTVQLGAKHGLHFYETNFTEILLPDNIDSGHIPIFGVYLAIIWSIFGKSLVVSHFAMLPFLCGIVLQSHRLISRFVHVKYVFWALTIFLLEPTLLGQAVLVSPDIPLVFFLLLALNGIWDNQRTLLSFGILGLFLISMRGGMVAFAILIMDLYLNFQISDKHPFKQLTKMSFAYLPGFLLFCLYNYLHFREKGWIAYHADSPWAPSFQHVGIMGFLKNIVVLGWRLLDFGRIFLWATGLFLTFKYIRKYVQEKEIKALFILCVVILLCSSISFLSYTGLNAHRYLLPVYLAFSLLVIVMLFHHIVAHKKIISLVLVLGLASGHFWIYPSHISQGWDSSLAHLPYYTLRERMMDEMKQMDIKIADVACVFPNNSDQRYMNLSTDTSKHIAFDQQSSKFVLYSNVYNDFSDDDIQYLKEGYDVKRHFEHFGVYMTLYERK